MGWLEVGPGVGVGRTREGGRCLEREREAFVLRAGTRKDKLGPWEYFSRGWNPAEHVPGNRKRVESITINADLTVKKYSEREGPLSLQESALVFNLVYLNQYCFSPRHFPISR